MKSLFKIDHNGGLSLSTIFTQQHFFPPQPFSFSGWAASKLIKGQMFEQIYKELLKQQIFS